MVVVVLLLLHGWIVSADNLSTTLAKECADRRSCTRLYAPGQHVASCLRRVRSVRSRSSPPRPCVCRDLVSRDLSGFLPTELGIYTALTEL
jgi:hypothetical protein